jgi:hypothetical protein
LVKDEMDAPRTRGCNNYRVPLVGCILLWLPFDFTRCILNYFGTPSVIKTQEP